MLLYVGTKDFVCNWFGNNEWSLELEWAHAGDYRKEELRPWFAADGAENRERKRAGLFRQAGGFAFATVDGAGHFVRRPFLSSFGPVPSSPPSPSRDCPPLRSPCRLAALPPDGRLL